MKRITSLLVAFLMLFCLSALVVGCDVKVGEADPDTAGKVLASLMDMAKAGADEYVNEVDNATHDDVEKLREDGNELLSSLDEVDKTLSEDGDDISAESKEQITNDVNELRQTVTDAMAKLDSK